MSRSRSRQRHSAGYQQQEVTVHYRYHPLAGAGMRVVGRSVQNGQEFLIAVQPDGTRTLLPAWMSRPESAKFVVSDALPCFPLAVLANLCRELEAVLSLLPGSTNTGDNNETPTQTPAMRFVRRPAGDAEGRSFTLGKPGRSHPAAGKAPVRDCAGGNERGEERGWP